MKVLKFGGTSVGSPENIQHVLELIRRFKATEHGIMVVVSAFGGVTDELIAISNLAARGDEDYRIRLAALAERHIKAIQALLPAKEQSHVLTQIKLRLNELEDALQGVYLVGELSVRTLDFIMSFGELFSAEIIADFLTVAGLDAELLDSRKVIRADESYGAGQVNFEETSRLTREYFSQHSKLQVAAGFIASTPRGETITLGRGGSDYTASIFGAALDVGEIVIFTDVDGVMTADPRKVPKALPLSSLTYEEAMELSHFGAKVIHPPTMQPALNQRIPIRIRNTFNHAAEGTLITEQGGEHSQLVTGVSSISKIALIRVQGTGMIGVAGTSSRIFGALSRSSINVILITQASSEHTVCFAVIPEAADLAERIINNEFSLEIQAKRVDPAIVNRSLCIVSVVGKNMSKRPGIAGRLFHSLGRNGINITAIAQGSSELNISTVVSRDDEAKALNAIHDEFFLSGTKSINIFMVGPGLIGGTLLRQMSANTDQLKRSLALDLHLVALTNSSHMCIDPAGIPLNEADKLLQESRIPGGMALMVQNLLSLNLPNSVLVDCSASAKVAEFYPQILEANIAVVTPNKKGLSGSQSAYRNLRRIADKRQVDFLYETCVGAGLPVISTLADLMRSGDVIESIEGVFSGTLSYIFNSFDGTQPFSSVVAEARERGFTEPDPRDDLNGLDVARKLLILAREVGISLELEQIDVENLVPAACREAQSIDDFFDALRQADAEFQQRLDAARQYNQKLCYIAALKQSKASVELTAIDSSHPFYGLSGADNIVSFKTSRYRERPLVVKGPGAGAEVTAAGVFADIIRVGKRMSRD